MAFQWARVRIPDGLVAAEAEPGEHGASAPKIRACARAREEHRSAGYNRGRCLWVAARHVSSHRAADGLEKGNRHPGRCSQAHILVRTHTRMRMYIHTPYILYTRIRMVPRCPGSVQGSL